MLVKFYYLSYSIIFVILYYNCQKVSSFSTITLGENRRNSRPTTVTHKKFIRKLSIRGGLVLDKIEINGVGYGGLGGNFKGSIDLNNDEYISRVYCTYVTDAFITYVEFNTNKNRTLKGGSLWPTGYSAKIENVRVIKIGALADEDHVYQLKIDYVPNYQPSTLRERDVGFILSYWPPFSQVEEYVGSREKRIQSYTKTIGNMDRARFDESISIDFIVKASHSSGFEFEKSNLPAFKRELEKSLEHTETGKKIIPESYIGIQLVKGQLLQEGNGTFWLFPTSTPTISIVKLNEVNSVLGYYDLTGTLFAMMPNLEKYKTMKNQFVYYDAESLRQNNEYALTSTATNAYTRMTDLKKYKTTENPYRADQKTTTDSTDQSDEYTFPFFIIAILIITGIMLMLMVGFAVSWAIGLCGILRAISSPKPKNRNSKMESNAVSIKNSINEKNSDASFELIILHT